MKKLFLTLAILAGFAVQVLASNSDYDFSSGDFKYSIISTDPPCVSVVGHVDGQSAHGDLIIPETVMRWDSTVFTVTAIGDRAFRYCSQLTGQFVIPNTVTTIGELAFDYCGLTGELIIPNSVVSIGGGAFEGCDGFTGNLVIPNSVRSIGALAFAYCRGFNGTLTLPNSLEVIEYGVFAECSGLTGTLNIPNSVVEIKYAAFYACNSFTGDLVIPESVVSLGCIDETNYPTHGTFCECTGFNGHLVLPESLEVIGTYCFDGCSNLTGELVIPSSVREIQHYAFADCSSLTGSLVLPNGLTYIGSHAFENCSGLSGELVIPDEVVEIPSYAFAGITRLTSVSIPNSVVRIGEGAFKNCEKLAAVNIPDGITEIAPSLFDHCSKLTEIVLPDGITTIRSSAFSNCTELASVNIPQSCDTIGANAFCKCEKLSSIDFPEGLLSVGMDAFFACDLIERVVIPNSVVDIATEAFIACNNLSYLVIGGSVERIGERAFLYTPTDTIVSLAAVPPTLGENVFYPNNYQTTKQIVVPCGFLDDYLMSGWATYFSEDTFVEDCGFDGAEWYYEIQNENGSITYQHLEYAADTTINHKDVQIIIRTNTLYDKGEHQEVTREYLYEEDEVVYWWNKDLQEFTVLYDLGAQEGDSWVIKVGTESLVMHVDAVDLYEYDGRLFKMLRVSDDDDIFSGNILCGVGHLSSFFPEKLMTCGKGFRVHGLRCYWKFGDLVFTINRGDCDAIYTDLHNGIEEGGPSTGSVTFTIYPNPTNGVLTIQHSSFRIQNSAFRITNLIGQTIQTGSLTAENQQIDVSDLPQGMYFITVGDATRKFVVR